MDVTTTAAVLRRRRCGARALAALWARGRHRLCDERPRPDKLVRAAEALYAAIADGQLLYVDGITAAQWGPAWLRKYRSGNRSYRDDRQRFEIHVATAA